MRDLLCDDHLLIRIHFRVPLCVGAPMEQLAHTIAGTGCIWSELLIRSYNGCSSGNGDANLRLKVVDR